MNPAGIPLGLYVHLPWCARKCPYCDFNSYTASTEPPRRRYIDALVRDLELNGRLAGEREIATVFIGGGTPSLFSPAEIGRIIEAIRERFRLAAGIEISMEANPGTVDCGDPAGYREAGINRLSIGAQSFSDAALRALGRIHASDAIGKSFDAARSAGFDNINLDLMYGLPGQDVAAALTDIDAAVALGPEHISWYHLTLEPNTVFYARPPAGLPGESLAADIQEAGAAALTAAGYAQYEVSAWAQAGRRCQHNLNYWRFGDYLAAGAGAHGKLTQPDGVYRFARPANPQAYMAALESGTADPGLARVEQRDIVFEYMLNAFRLRAGFDLAQFENTTGLSRREVEPALRELEARRLLSFAGASRLRPTEQGFRFVDDLVGYFLPAGPGPENV